ncbi:hypothetical protein FACS1894132_08370 [Clostridia bacterium]|nr:hypothetical protein FACS1894132_08370 [Clostridia bacterium]
MCPDSLAVAEYDSSDPYRFTSENTEFFYFRDCKAVPFTPSYFYNFDLNSVDFLEFMQSHYKRLMGTYYYLVAIPDDASDIEIKLFYDFLKQYKCKDVIIVRQGVLLSNQKSYISITKSCRGICFSVIRNATVTLQEFLPVDVVCQEQLQTTIRFKRIIDMLQIDDNFPVLSYQSGTYKFGEEVKFSDIKYNSIAFMNFK